MIMVALVLFSIISHAQGISHSRAFHMMLTKCRSPNATKESSISTTSPNSIGMPGQHSYFILEEMREQGVINVRRIKVRHDVTLKDTNTFVFTFNTSVLPKQLKVAFLRVSVDPNIPNPLRCYACQVFGHHENKCHREEICANCGESKHSADETDCKRPPKCFNCKEDHPANSRQCQAWHTEKEILKVKYTRNISFPEARKIVESYTAAPGKSYASRRLLVSQYHVLMLRHKQTLYLSQRLHSLRLTIQHQTKHLQAHNKTRRKR